MEIPGVGPLLASAFVASIADPTVFKSGRDVAAWIGLVPKQNSSGGKERLGSISRAGNRYLRQMLVVGAMAVIRHAERHGTKRAVAHPAACQAREEGRCGCLGEQDRPDGLGVDDERRALPRTDGDARVGMRRSREAASTMLGRADRS